MRKASIIIGERFSILHLLFGHRMRWNGTYAVWHNGGPTEDGHCIWSGCSHWEDRPWQG